MPNPTKRKLTVLANPFHALDADDRPMGAVPYEREPHRHVGAEHDRDETLRARAVVFRFHADPVEVPDTVYYRRKLADGELLPGDAATADIVTQMHRLREGPKAPAAAFGASALSDAHAKATAAHKATFGDEHDLAGVLAIASRDHAQESAPSAETKETKL